MNCGPLSESIVFENPNVEKNINSASQMSCEVTVDSAIASGYLEQKSASVRMYLLPYCVGVRSPMMSKDIRENGNPMMNCS